MKLAEKILRMFESKDIRDEKVALKLIRQFVKKKLEFDDYDMNDYPLFLDKDGNEYWVEEDKTVYTSGDRGSQKKLGVAKF